MGVPVSTTRVIRKIIQLTVAREVAELPFALTGNPHTPGGFHCLRILTLTLQGSLFICLDGYYWCSTRKGWDYCSPRNNYDYSGNACSKDHLCGKHGYDYYWCNLEKGDWGYCAPVEPRAMIHQTRYQKDCIDNCQYYEFGKYFWCHTQDGYEYCSPLPDVTYQNEPCRPDNKCDTHGEEYSWCYTDETHWDYCGVINPGECRNSLPRRSKRQPNTAGVIHTCKDQNGRVITFRGDGNRGIADSNKKLRNEALDLINQWSHPSLSNPGTISKSSNVRIDLQGSFNRNNLRYHNLQIQMNTQRSSGSSTTIAQASVPDGTSDEYIRLALKLSLEKGVKVEVSPPETNQSTRTCGRSRQK
uniref:Uncharacterized protein n=1 Tax=Paramormyrops kingsleyae TaxID=1676925 RepID=A0A3B3TCY9_9TELE